MRRGLTGGWIQASVTVDPALKGISALIIWSTKPLNIGIFDGDDDVLNDQVNKDRKIYSRRLVVAMTNLKRRTTRMPPMINETPNKAETPGR